VKKIEDMTWDEVQAYLQKVYARDRERILAGEVKPQELFWFTHEMVKDAKITWPKRFKP
jgi:hypothetical protein